jgi:hypothetical protein
MCGPSITANMPLFPALTKRKQTFHPPSNHSPIRARELLGFSVASNLKPAMAPSIPLRIRLLDQVDVRSTWSRIDYDFTSMFASTRTSFDRKIKVEIEDNQGKSE